MVEGGRVLTGYIMGYRRGWNEQYPDEVLLRIEGVNSKGEACKLIGCRVIVRDKHGNVYRGRIVRAHGRRGVVRAVFKPNIPGQLIGSIAEVHVK